MSVTSIFLFSAALWSGPPLAYQQSRQELEATAASLGDHSPTETIARLDAALASVTQYPHELLADPGAVEAIGRARLALVWSQLANGDVVAATATMDLAIRSAGPNPLPITGLGPDLRKLHDERRAALESAGQATIVVDCDGCEVLIDEARSDNPSAPLLLGSHRVWLLDPHEQLEPRFMQVDLDTADGALTLDYRPAPAEFDLIVPDMPGPAPERARALMVPRWVKIVGAAVGASLVVTGGVLLSLDGKCQGGGAPTPESYEAGACKRVWTNTAPSYALFAVGGATLVGASAWLTVDEVRVGRSPRVNAMLGWTMRF